MKTYIFPYNMGSQSSKKLAAALNVKRIKLEGSKFKPNGQNIINWGSTKIPAVYKLKCNVLNSVISNAVNKLKFFQTVEGEEWCVPFTTDKETAKSWTAEGAVVCRTVLNGHSGEGIVIAETADEVVDAPLYTRYIKKKEEYRIHVVDGKIIFMQKKSRKLDVPDEEVNWKVRNHANGFIYAHQGVDIPECVKASAIACMQVLGLFFGAVDIIYNEKQNKAYVLEVNTSPGLEGETLNRYKLAFEAYV